MSPVPTDKLSGGLTQIIINIDINKVHEKIFTANLFGFVPLFWPYYNPYNFERKGGRWIRFPKQPGFFLLNLGQISTSVYWYSN
jgi:hypothetical protein